MTGQTEIDNPNQLHALWWLKILFDTALACGKPYEPRHDKINKMSVRAAKTQISLGIRPV